MRDATAHVPDHVFLRSERDKYNTVQYNPVNGHYGCVSNNNNNNNPLSKHDLV